MPKTSQNRGRKKCSAVEALQEISGCIFSYVVFVLGLCLICGNIFLKTVFSIFNYLIRCRTLVNMKMFLVDIRN